MSIKDFVRERDLRSCCFITETTKISDITDFINACNIYMNNKDIEKIRINLSFDFIESPEEEKKKLNQ